MARTAHFALHHIAPDPAHPLWHLPHRAMLATDTPLPLWLGALTRHLIEWQVHAVGAPPGEAGAYVVRLRAAFVRAVFQRRV